jgi:hypothetical protein
VQWLLAGEGLVCGVRLISSASTERECCLNWVGVEARAAVRRETAQLELDAREKFPVQCYISSSCYVHSGSSSRKASACGRQLRSSGGSV